MLHPGRDKDAADLADQLALRPEAAGLVEEIPHLRRHVAEAGRRAEDDRVVVGQLFGRRDRRGLVELDMGLFGDVARHQLRHALDRDFRTGDRSRTVGDGTGHRLDMAVAAVIEDENLAHFRAPAFRRGMAFI